MLMMALIFICLSSSSYLVPTMKLSRMLDYRAIFALQMGIHSVRVQGYSRLIIKLVTRESEVKEIVVVILSHNCPELSSDRFKHVSRADNRHVDTLATLGLRRTMFLARQLLLELIWLLLIHLMNKLTKFCYPKFEQPSSTVAIKDLKNFIVIMANFTFEARTLSLIEAIEELHRIYDISCRENDINLCRRLQR